MFMDNHHGDGRIAMWCKTMLGEQADMVEFEPDRYFVPPYVGPKGWVGVRLDKPKPDWKLIEWHVLQSWRMSAPMRLASRMP
jgi:phosphoribosylglycinamide formyltransferase-1